MSAIDQAMNQAISEGVFPSAQLLVARGGKVVHHAAYGNATLETIYDIASLTKPIATTTLVMLLSGRKGGRGIIDDPISKYLPTPPDKKGILIRHLLNHSSGLPAWQPYYQIVPADDVATPRGKEQIISAALNEPLVSEIGWQSIYSDIGFILLGEVVERVSERPLDELFADLVAKPLKLQNTFFVPIKRGTKDEGRRAKEEGRGAKHDSSIVLATEGSDRPSSLVFAPTEHCPWRKRVVQGEVHDQNAYAMGGVAGHAGLFSTTTDINKFVSEFVKCYRGKGSFLTQEVVQQFISPPLPSPALSEVEGSLVPPPSSFVPRPSGGSTWLLGWDRPSHPVSQAGQYFSQESIGHLGYTGCSLWIDFKNDFWVVLLTNRIHPVSTNEKIRGFRPMLYDLIAKQL